jgi:hypothetical protein
VSKPIAAHRYRTVIGTLSKDESRFFLKECEKSFAPARRRIRDRICPHPATIFSIPAIRLADICPHAGKSPKFPPKGRRFSGLEASRKARPQGGIPGRRLISQ